jgi:hypothetical protein
MAKVIVPIVKLDYSAEAMFDNEVMEVFWGFGIWKDDEVTYTGRVALDLSTDAGRGIRLAAIQSIRLHLGADQAERLIALLDEYEWDLSFFVDCW